MTDKVRWGVISTANIGKQRVIPAIMQSHNGEVIAVASRNQATARAFADELGIRTAYGSYEELIADPDVDAIYNPLPNSMHAEWSIKCAEAGKPTLCEKPLASNAAQAQQMVDAFAERDVLFAEAFMYRFHTQTQRVLHMIEEGAVGDLRAIQASFTFNIGNEANIRLSKELDGGSLMDVGCYCVNVMRLITGEEPTPAKAIANFGATSGVDEALAGVLHFPSGVVGHLDCGLRTYRTHSYEIRGTDGRIQVNEGFVMAAETPTKIRWWQDDLYGELAIPAANSYTLMVEDFADALLNNRPPRYAPQDGVNNMKVIDELLASARA
jgi:D-xylose 1-dehydrogenase (NADP+, D-xylono-1,5-lactone-forming)